MSYVYQGKRYYTREEWLRAIIEAVQERRGEVYREIDLSELDYFPPDLD